VTATALAVSLLNGFVLFAADEFFEPGITIVPLLPFDGTDFLLQAENTSIEAAKNIRSLMFEFLQEHPNTVPKKN